MNKETASTMIRQMRDNAREIERWYGYNVFPHDRPIAPYARGMADAYTIVLGMLADDVVDGPWASVMGPARSAPEDQ